MVEGGDWENAWDAWIYEATQKTHPGETSVILTMLPTLWRSFQEM